MAMRRLKAVRTSQALMVSGLMLCILSMLICFLSFAVFVIALLAFDKPFSLTPFNWIIVCATTLGLVLVIVAAIMIRRDRAAANT
jgi:uncharacterized membrane protein YidH (DUF202 family)